MKRTKDINNQFICGDALAELRKLPEESVDMCLTSPPYWGLRDYGNEQTFGGDKKCEHEWDRKIKKWHSDRGKGPKKEVFDDTFQVKGTRDDTCIKCQAWRGQLGLEPTPEMYIEHSTEIFNEVKRVLKKEGTLWLNIGDTYSGGGHGGHKEPHGKQVSLCGKSIIKSELQHKCLLMIPERLAWSLIQNGWILRNKIIWYKPNAMPSSVTDRFSNRWEYLFMFSKSSMPVYWTNKKTLKLVTKQPAGIKGIEEVDWKWERCPRCEGCGEIAKEAEEGHKKCSRCNGSGEIKMSFWTAHDYYFDLDAVREAYTEPMNRWGGDNLVAKGESTWDKGTGQETYRDRNMRPNPEGKNPGDVFEAGAETRTMGAIIGSGGGVKVPGGKGWTGHPKGGGAACQKDPRWCPPEGKRPIDFWEINTQPFPEAHFAVFPEKLCEKPIRAGCPEKVCPKCGRQ